MNTSCYVPVISVPEPEMYSKIKRLGRFGMESIASRIKGYFIVNNGCKYRFSETGIAYLVATTSGEITPFWRSEVRGSNSANDMLNCLDHIFMDPHTDSIPHYIDELRTDALGKARLFYLSELDYMFFWRTGYLVQDRPIKKLILSPVLFSIEIVSTTDIVIRTLPVILSMYGSPARTSPEGISQFLSKVSRTGIYKSKSLPQYLHRFFSTDPDAPLKVPKIIVETPEEPK